MPKKKGVKNSEKELNDGSEEWLNFEHGLKQIFSLTPEQAKAIRESPVPKEPRKKKRKSN